MTANFTMGIIFSPDLKNVYLLRKDRPEFQAGLLNGVGGKLNPGESYADCMVREGMEESGYSGEWYGLGSMRGNTEGWGEYQCEIFYSVMAEGTVGPHTCEREEIEKHPVADLATLTPQMVNHLPMLIMASLAHQAAKPGDKFSLDVTCHQKKETTQELELKPCPRCGGRASIGTIRYEASYARSEGWQQSEFYFVNCIEFRCGIKCKGMVGFSSPEEAVERWNQRPMESALRAEIEDLKTTLDASTEETRHCFSMVYQAANEIIPGLRAEIDRLREVDHAG